MAVNINVPSQVKTYANLAAFPATGALKTIYIAEDTNKTYRWTGSVYTEISASAAMTWGTIGGTLSNQTDLQNALDAKVPTSRTLTINGVTQDLSADRTFTISTGITIGTTAITSGVVGRVLFEGVGNVVQESANLFWDNTNGRLGIGTSSPARRIDVLGSGDVLTGLKTTSATGAASHVVLNDVDSSFEFGMWGSTRTSYGAISSNNAYIYGGVDFAITSLSNIKFGSGASVAERMRIVGGNGNVLIGTTTDAGFKLDVNGTARVQGNVQFGTQFSWTNSSQTLYLGGALTLGGNTDQISASSNSGNFDFLSNLPIRFLLKSGSVERMRIVSSTGNILIGTNTDAGFRLDVNGTARMVSGTTGTTPVLSVTNTSSGNFTFLVNNSGSGNANFGMQIDGSTKASIGYSRTGDFLGFYVDGATANYFLGQYNIDGSFQKNRTSDGIADFKVFNGGGTIIGAATLNASAQLQVDSTTKGFLPPRLTTTQKNAIASPAAGLVVYDTTLNKLCVRTASAWETITSL